jgi:hypothetical protein
MPLRSIRRETGTWNLLFVVKKAIFFLKKQSSFLTESSFLKVIFFFEHVLLFLKQFSFMMESWTPIEFARLLTSKERATSWFDKNGYTM